MTAPLKRHGLPGLLIAFEGIDGCGKGTQIELLHKRLVAEGYGDKVVLTKQPGDTALGAAVRDILFHSIKTHNIEPNACTLLYLIGHLQTMQDVIIPALTAGKIVISDRWDRHSGTVFGNHGLRVPVHPDVQALRRTLAGFEPDLTFLLKGDPAVLLERAQGRTAETHEAGKVWANVAKLRKLQNAYEDLLGTNPRVVFMPAEMRADILADHIWWWVKPALCQTNAQSS